MKYWKASRARPFHKSLSYRGRWGDENNLQASVRDYIFLNMCDLP